MHTVKISYVYVCGHDGLWYIRSTSKRYIEARAHIPYNIYDVPKAKLAQCRHTKDTGYQSHNIDFARVGMID